MPTWAANGPTEAEFVADPLLRSEASSQRDLTGAISGLGNMQVRQLRPRIPP